MGRPYTLIFRSFVKYYGAVGLALSGGFPPGRRNRLSRPPRHKCATQSTRIGTQPNQRAGQRKPHRVAHLRNRESTLAGTMARDDEFYRGVLRNGGERTYIVGGKCGLGESLE